MDENEKPPQEINLTEEGIAAHAAAMEGADWWWIYEREAALPACPRCGARQILSIDGSAICEEECGPDTDDGAQPRKVNPSS